MKSEMSQFRWCCHFDSGLDQKAMLIYPHQRWPQLNPFSLNLLSSVFGEATLELKHSSSNSISPCCTSFRGGEVGFFNIKLIADKFLTEISTCECVIYWYFSWRIEIFFCPLLYKILPPYIKKNPLQYNWFIALLLEIMVCKKMLYALYYHTNNNYYYNS